jgi:hypothetical protein
MTHGFLAPAGWFWMGSYMDDLFVMLTAEADEAGRPLADDDLTAYAIAAPCSCERRPNLHSSKGQERLAQAVVWGAQIDGERDSVRGEAQVAYKLIKVTVMALLEGSLSPHMAASLTSPSTPHIMFAPASLCRQDVYALDGRCPTHRVQTIPVAVADEFWSRPSCHRCTSANAVHPCARKRLPRMPLRRWERLLLPSPQAWSWRGCGLASPGERCVRGCSWTAVMILSCRRQMSEMRFFTTWLASCSFAR